jgi:hypothetical protein
MRSQEPRSNWGFVCEECAPAPDPQFANKPLHEFIGKHVKLGFPTASKPEFLEKTDPWPEKEHMWVKVTEYNAENELIGYLDNDPKFCEINSGNMIAFTREEVEAVIDMAEEKGKAHESRKN